MSDTFDNKEQLFEAAQRGDIETVKLFVEEKGAPITITNDQGETLAHIASRNGKLDVVQYVLRKEPSILKKIDKKEYSILHIAVEKGDIDIVKYLVEKQGASITTRNRRELSRTPVHTAVQFGHLNILRYFIDERKANVDEPGEFQDRPPVFLAVQYKQHDVLEYLIEEKRADLTAIDFYGENILYAAVRGDDLNFMKRILDEKKIRFDLNARNKDGETLVFRAVVLKRSNIVKYLVEKKRVDVNISENWENKTPLHIAASQNDYKTCKFLIAHGANTRLKDKFRTYPAQEATNQTLVEYIENVSAKMRNRRSISLAKEYASPDTMPVLVPSECAPQSVKKLPSGVAMDYFSNEDAVVSLRVTDSSHFRSLLLVIAELFIRNAGRRSVRGTFLSPRTIAMKRIDPIAVTAINYGVPDCEES